MLLRQVRSGAASGGRRGGVRSVGRTPRPSPGPLPRPPTPTISQIPQLFAGPRAAWAWPSGARAFARQSKASSDDLFEQIIQVETQKPTPKAPQAPAAPTGSEAPTAPRPSAPKAPAPTTRTRISRRKMSKRQRARYDEKIAKAVAAYRRGKEREAVAIQRNISSSIKKLQPLAILITKMPVDQALEQLKWLNKKTAPILRRTLRSAQANARQFGLDQSKLIVSKVLIGKGTYLTRLYTHARHRAGIMQRPRIHLTVCVRESKPEESVKRVKQYKHEPFSTKLAAKLNLPRPQKTASDSQHPLIARLHKRPHPTRLDHPAAIEFALSGLSK